jgi:hypothetical protein
MLIDAIADSEEELRTMRAVLRRRINYLSHRARVVEEREIIDPRLKWTNDILAATLRLEGAESAVALGDLAAARSELRAAVVQFLNHGFPFGVVLKQLFLHVNDFALDAQAERVLAAWGRIPAESDESKVGPSSDEAEVVTWAQRSPQQWAYHVMARALGGDANPSDDNGAHFLPWLQRWSQTAVGRMRIPMAAYLQVMRYSGESGRNLDEQVDIIELLSDQIGNVSRAVKAGRNNRYLWVRGLSPVPWFDFDTGILVAAVLASSAKMREETERSVVGRVNRADRGYAQEFLSAVTALVRGPEPEKGIERLRAQ